MILGNSVTPAGSGGGSATVMNLYADYSLTTLYVDTAHTTTVLDYFNEDFDALYDAFEAVDVINIYSYYNPSYKQMMRFVVTYLDIDKVDETFTIGFWRGSTFKTIYLF